MTLMFRKFTLGPLGNNSYLVYDPNSRKAVVIDPSFDSQTILNFAQQKNLDLTQIWLTHAHFDHMAGVQIITKAYASAVLGLHPADLALWRAGGSASSFGMQIDTSLEPSILFQHQSELKIGSYALEVRHTPGHTPGHVVFYHPQTGVVFCGDLIFKESVGRTDLPGGNQDDLFHSIDTQILTLPASTRLLCGHGLDTTVGDEMRDNPFIN
jgi:hydroxyacylglutathione hydrolase